MPGWHVDDQALQFALGDPLKCVRHDLVMATRYEPRPHQLDEVQVMLLSGLPGLRLVQSTKKPEDLRLLRFGYLVNQFGVIHAMIIWCRGRDSNSRPTAYKAVALPAELPRLVPHKAVNGSHLVLVEVLQLVELLP